MAPDHLLGNNEVGRTEPGDDVTNIDQLLLRPALGYQLTENLSLWQGYAWVGHFNQPHTPPRPAFFQETDLSASHLHPINSVTLSL
ncbi:MAG: DUF2490 domain-containing protein [Nitrospira sp.]|nr:DUF2490 domain-containing protein [Nitrospira sp.]